MGFDILPPLFFQGLVRSSCSTCEWKASHSLCCPGVSLLHFTGDDAVRWSGIRQHGGEPGAASHLARSPRTRRMRRMLLLMLLSSLALSPSLHYTCTSLTLPPSLSWMISHPQACEGEEKEEEEEDGGDPWRATPPSFLIVRFFPQQWGWVLLLLTS